MQMFEFSNDLNILNNSSNNIKKAARILEQAANKVRLKINLEKQN